MPLYPDKASSSRGASQPSHESSQASGEPRRITSGQIRAASQVAFHRTELGLILNVYGHMVSQGEWKDYAIDFLKDKAVFSIYRRASEHPLYTIEKNPRLKDKQGQFSVTAPGGLILKRGHDLKAVLRVFNKQRFRLTR